MANRFFTILVIPEKTSQVRRLVVPSWLLRGVIVALFFVVALGVIMMVDYWYVMSQVNENKQLRMENRRLRQQVQVFRNKMATIEGTLDRVKTFTTRLRVITNIEDRGELLQSLNRKLPDAATNIGSIAGTAKQQAAAEAAAASDSTAQATDAGQSAPANSEAAAEPATYLFDEGNPENAILRREYEELDNRFSLLNHNSLYVEQQVQDLYELLADKKSFLAARPTKKPAVGYFTSGFGVRRSPYGDRVKMHEGLDIANYPGTPIKATADGLVKYANTKPGYGQTVIVDHGYGLETWYSHCRRLLVAPGQKVKRGEQIALLGNSGYSTGPHVHYEVRVHDVPVDPLSFILEN